MSQQLPLCPERPPGAEVCPTSGTVWWFLLLAGDRVSPERTAPSGSPDAPSSCNDNATVMLLLLSRGVGFSLGYVKAFLAEDALLPFVDLFFNIFCTESFHLKVDSAGLETHNSKKIISYVLLRRKTVSPNLPGVEWSRRKAEVKTECVYLPGVLWARLQGDRARQVQRNLKTHQGKNK